MNKEYKVPFQPKYLGMYYKIDSKGKAKYKINEYFSQEEMKIDVEIMNSMGWIPMSGYEFKVSTRDYIRMGS